MGWASGGEIFDGVANSLIGVKASDEVKEKVLSDLIGSLRDLDWDTEDESLEAFAHDPAIVRAFASHDVHPWNAVQCPQCKHHFQTQGAE